jgi:hypothetical protein
MPGEEEEEDVEGEGEWILGTKGLVDKDLAKYRSERSLAVVR